MAPWTPVELGGAENWAWELDGRDSIVIGDFLGDFL